MKMNFFLFLFFWFYEEEEEGRGWTRMREGIAFLGKCGNRKIFILSFFGGIVVRGERGVVDVYYQHDTFFLTHRCLSTSPSSLSFPSHSQPAVPPKRIQIHLLPPQSPPQLLPPIRSSFHSAIHNLRQTRSLKTLQSSLRSTIGARDIFSQLRRRFFARRGGFD